MPQLDLSTFAPQIIWLVITFGILYLVMARSALPRVGNILQERAVGIAEDQELAEKLREESKAVETAYQLALSDARAEAGKALNDARAGVTADMEAQKAKLDSKLAEQAAAAQAAIKAATDAALKELEGVAGDACTAIVARLIDTDADSIKVVAAVRAASATSSAGSN